MYRKGWDRIQDNLRRRHWLLGGLTVRLNLIHTRLNLIYNRLNLIHNRLNLILESYLLVTCRVVSRTPCRGVVDTSVGCAGCHLVVVLLAGIVRLAFHLLGVGYLCAIAVHSFIHFCQKVAHIKK
jgi:hypothetical protein